MRVESTATSLLEEGVRALRASAAARDLSATPDLDAEVLLAHVLNLSRTELKSHPEVPVAAAQAKHYRELLVRRARGEPVAYLVGSREFWSLTLQVSEAVLVPRPETEFLVERALALHTAPKGNVADLGTGSGAVALALASERAHWRLIATDVSEAALALARDNAARLKLASIEFRHGSWFEPLGGERFDLIVSNPPYIAADDPVLECGPLAHEPRAALTPGADALASLRTLAQGAAPHLRRGGWLLLEHGATQAEAVRRELVLAGFGSVRSHRDLAGHERMTEGQHS